MGSLTFVSALSPLPQHITSTVMVYQHISSDMKDCTLQLWEIGWAKEDICSVLTVSQSSLYCWAPPSLMQGRPRIIGMAAMTRKRTETELNTTKSNWTIGCSCPHFEVGWVAGCPNLSNF